MIGRSGHCQKFCLVLLCNLAIDQIDETKTISYSGLITDTVKREFFASVKFHKRILI